MTDHRNQGLQPTDTPNILYKYVPFNKYSLRLLKDSEIWLASPGSFNDPFDSKLHYNYKVNNPTLRKKWAEGVVRDNNPGLTKSVIKSTAKDLLDDMDKDPNARLKWFEDYQEELTDSKFGIFSVSTKPDNLLLWAHYASDHQGFCVGIDTYQIGRVQLDFMKRKHLLELKRVEYSSKYPDINFYESMMSTDWANDIVRLLITKSIDWKYEEEYRLLSWDKSNVGVKLPKYAIREIVLGYRMKPHNKAVIHNLAIRELKHAELFAAGKSVGRFSLVLNRI